LTISSGKAERVGVATGTAAGRQQRLGVDPYSFASPSLPTGQACTP